jgi:response regulator RpfG family c-di-GMP phosphodiesterase
MPEMSGAEFLATVRKRWPQTVRILLTGYSDVDSTVAAINAGQIARYVSKPWNDAEMLLIAREALERKHLQDEKLRLDAIVLERNEQLNALNATLEKKVEARTVQLAAALKTVESARANLYRGLLNSVRVFAGVQELRRGALAAHGKRVAERARATAQHLGLKGADLQNVAIASLLHDIGLLSLPDRALDTPFRTLKSPDLEEFLKHPAHGAGLLAMVEPLREAAELVRAHHERFDGMGFPGARRGSEIPLGARVLSVADDFDDLLTGRLMRSPMTPATAMNALREGRGKRYDPAVVDAYAHLYGQAQAAAAPRELVLRCSQLEPGMILARDIIAPDGSMLLVGDYALDADLIDGLVKYERSAGTPIQVVVRISEPAQAVAA